MMPLAPWKPLELLAKMLRLFPMGLESSAFLNCLFLNKPSSKLHILLSETDMLDKQALGTRAVSFAAHNDVMVEVATISLREQEGEDTSLAEVCPWTSSCQHIRDSGQ
jgi:hypothetical protein